MQASRRTPIYRTKVNTALQTQFGMMWKCYLLMNVQLAEDFSGVQQVDVIKDPKYVSTVGSIAPCMWHWWCLLLRIPDKQRQVQDQRQPVAIDQEHNSQETMDGSLRDNVGVQAVAKVNRVDVVAIGKKWLAKAIWSSLTVIWMSHCADSNVAWARISEDIRSQWQANSACASSIGSAPGM